MLIILKNPSLEINWGFLVMLKSIPLLIIHYSSLRLTIAIPCLSANSFSEIPGPIEN